MKVTAPVVNPLSSARRPAVSGPWLATSSRHRISVLISLLELLGHAVVELGGGTEVAQDLGVQLLSELRT